ncbi:hypothetical protein BB559_003419 [Furculomyces boomerangus]|uniref:N-(5'-phosphoribosyl)anthranilate isomerase n=2 Tax=Harpellales TaxID=61421 RepID=A0A2T9YLF7_9FUNG|nr:hypothetical protein BB559_003419 [Furculomyces boomerangus]PVZ99530.1 hypothetical protein BB558_004425 [Smittium angustum]
MDRNMKTKICGVKQVIDGLEAAKQGANFIGMIFAPSPRCIEITTAQDLISSVKATLPPNIANIHLDKLDASKYNFALKTENQRWFRDYSALVDQIDGQRPLFVGVFSNQSVDYIKKVCEQVDLDIIQLHGSEPLEIIDQLPKPVTKVFQVGSDFLPSNEIGTGGKHAFVLLDTKVEGQNVQGGHGVSFDWKIAKNVSEQFGINLILAGGLTPENVDAAIHEGKPWGVDVSSGVETNTKGVKDFEKIKSFISNAKSA